MAEELTPVDISDRPELVRLAEEVQESRRPRVLRRDGVDLAVLMPAAPRRRGSRGGPVGREDPLFGLIGIGERGIEGGVSGRKHEFLVRAYRPR